ncbi:hypothetical protein BH10BAC3_BH10BAC3_13960 [soil metagenome]
METIDLKQELLRKIAATEDEALLALLHENVNKFTNPKYENSFFELDPEDRLELIDMLEEDEEKNVAGEDEYQKATSKWRTKS